MSAWIPALHAGMTQSRCSTKTDRGALRLSYFQKDEVPKGTKLGYPKALIRRPLLPSRVVVIIFPARLRLLWR